MIIRISTTYISKRFYSESTKNEQTKPFNVLICLAKQNEIIGENPQKHWDKNKEIACLPIMNRDLTIKDADTKANLEDTAEFRIQIQELLDLKVIRKSCSRYRSPAFMVRNHAEKVRGKARMVINYKRLKDNTYNDD